MPEPLEVYVCDLCEGKGRVRSWLLFRHACSECAGTGYTLPTWYGHHLTNREHIRKLREIAGGRACGIVCALAAPAKTGNVVKLTPRAVVDRMWAAFDL